MGVRGGRGRGDTVNSFNARDFISIENYDTSEPIYLRIPKWVQQTLKSELGKHQTENFETYNSAVGVKRMLETKFIKLERKRIDEWFRKHKKHY